MHRLFNLDLLSANDNSIVNTWSTNFSAKSIYHMAQQRTLQNLTEAGGMSEDGSQVLAYSAVFHCIN